ncbi:hypothetical protein BSZ21_03470 [Bradyrhizobium canariense]|nr:hypothetical protein BSZ21_03470 [Bradyrhizobium canariense]
MATILLAWLAPTDNIWVKAAVGGIAWIIILAAVFWWSYLRYKPEPIKAELSPLYTSAGLNHFRSIQRAEFDEISRLTEQSARLGAAMSKHDVTTEAGQRALRDLALQKKPIDERLAVLKKQQRRIGFFRG